VRFIDEAKASNIRGLACFMGMTAISVIACSLLFRRLIQPVLAPVPAPVFLAEAPVLRAFLQSFPLFARPHSQGFTGARPPALYRHC
jgi:hypothetical protein